MDRMMPQSPITRDNRAIRCDPPPGAVAEILPMPFDFSVVTAPFRMQPGLRRLAVGARQLSPLVLHDRWMVEKLQVLSRHPMQAMVQAPDFDARPALHAMLQHAAQEHPELITCSRAEGVQARHLGWGLASHEVTGQGPAAIGECLRGLPPQWRLAGLLSLAFAEDFAVIESDGRIPWAAVCLPSHWAPQDKVGRSFVEVHSPVADNELLLAAAGHLARLVTGPDRWERFVWTITPHATLDQHPARVCDRDWTDLSDSDPDRLVSQAWLRTERQTFIPLPDAKQAVFTIRVDVAPLAQSVCTADDARRLRAALETMSDAVLDYRGLAHARDRLINWLAARSALPESGASIDPA